MLDWTQIDSDPTAIAVRAKIRDLLRNTNRGVRYSKDELVEEFVRGQDVLDVGVAEHTVAHANSPDWLHAKVVRWAKSAVGIDNNAEVAKELVRRGFDVRVVDATGEADLGARFDRVVLGEIIEHVNDPVGLLKFAGRHLRPQGRVLVTSPNPFYIAHPYESWREGVFVPNAEHVRWVSPAMVLEIGRRAGLSLSAWWCLHPDPAHARIKMATLLRLARYIPRAKEMLANTYVYELSN